MLLFDHYMATHLQFCIPTNTIFLLMRFASNLYESDNSLFIFSKEVCLISRILLTRREKMPFWYPLMDVYSQLFPYNPQSNVLSNYGVCFWNYILFCSTLDRPWEDIYLTNMIFSLRTLLCTGQFLLLKLNQILVFIHYNVGSIFLVLHFFPPLSIMDTTTRDN